MQDQQIVARLRVVSEAVKPFQYFRDEPELASCPMPGGPGEVIEVKAVGVWGHPGEFVGCQSHTDQPGASGLPGWPVSLHITVPPGCGAIPVFGDDIQITVTRAESLVEADPSLGA
jgi:hypothetical protein